MSISTYYTEIQGVYQLIPCMVEYEYDKGDWHTNHTPAAKGKSVRVLRILRCRDNKDVTALIPRLLEEPKYIEDLEQRILDEIESSAMDYEIFSDF